jgi:hypothetical protein
LETLTQFRLNIVRYTLLLTLACAAGSWPLNAVVAKGVLMGGIAGSAGFWINAYVIQKLASPNSDTLTYTAFKWTFVRLIFYALAIYKAYTLDREHYYGVIAAVVGIFLVQVVMITVAFTSLDQPGRGE